MTNDDGWKSLDVIRLEIFGSKRTRDDVGCSSLCALPVSYPLQAGGFGQLPAGGSSFSLTPCKQVASANCQQGVLLSLLPPASRWLRPTASRGFFFLSYPLQAGGFGQLPAGGSSFSLTPCKQVASANCQQGVLLSLLPPASRWLRPTASRGFFFLSYPLQAGGFGQLPAGGASAGSADPPSFSL
uniref:cDNA n=1 Tax=Meloidogyne hapla TaxID=6305 RepID=A0A1I8BII7_MELHA